ncbi:enoyl-CoA hydratase/isomerase family protein [Thermodesulfobacteriota bacterium]
MEQRYGPAEAPSKLIEKHKEVLKEEILLEKNPKEKMAWITINRPEKLNTILDSHYAYLAQMMSELDWDDDVKVIIFKGAGRCFGAGHDIAGLGIRHGIDIQGQERRPSQRQRILVDRAGGVRGTFNLTDYIRKSVKTTIAQVHSYCYGAHMFMAMACDMIVAAPDALFTHPGFRYIGPTNDLGLLFRSLPLKIVQEMVLTGRALNAQEAFQYGLVNRVVPFEQLEAEVMKMARAAAALPFDGIVTGKAAIEGVLEAAGVGQGNYIGNLVHALQTNMRYEPGEFNLLRSRREKGIKGATVEREDHWNDDEALRK